jgi:hypothetical protein
MKLSKNEKLEILPLLQRAVQAKIDEWDSTRQIEGIVDAELDSMSDGVEHLAVGYDTGAEVTLEDVQVYIDTCVEMDNAECDCADRSWYGKEHDSACPLAGQPNPGSLVE